MGAGGTLWELWGSGISRNTSLRAGLGIPRHLGGGSGGSGRDPIGALGILDFKEHLPTGWGWGSQGFLERPTWIWKGSYRVLAVLGFKEHFPTGRGLGSKWVQEGSYWSLGARRLRGTLPHGGLGFQGTPPYRAGLGALGVLEESRWVQEGSYGSFGVLGFQGTLPYGLGLGVPRHFGGTQVDLGGILWEP